MKRSSLTQELANQLALLVAYYHGQKSHDGPSKECQQPGCRSTNDLLKKEFARRGGRKTKAGPGASRTAQRAAGRAKPKSGKEAA